MDYQYNTKSKTGWGYYVEIEHSNGYVSRYAHLTKGSVKVTEGQEIKDGAIIALSGASGGVTGPHLHLELLLAGKHIDPMSKEDLQLFLNELNGVEEKAVNENNPILLDEVTVTAEGPEQPKSIEARIEDMLWQSVRANAYGNTGRYNQQGRTCDQYYSDEFLKWYYGVK